MFLPEKKYRIRFLESNIEQRISDLSKKLRNEEALIYLKRGVGARHYILRSCKDFLAREAFSERTTLSPSMATESALHLNGYYLNLRGVLDNLAWVLQYEFNIFPGISEDSKNKQKIHLFGTEFIDKLATKSCLHAQPLRAKQKWGLDLSDFRDPAAHRLPLYVPSGVIASSQQLEEFQRLDSLAGAPEEVLQGKRRIEIIMEAQQVAIFQPIFCITSIRGIKVYSISQQLMSDHRRYLHLLRKVFQAF